MGEVEESDDRRPNHPDNKSVDHRHRHVGRHHRPKSHKQNQQRPHNKLHRLDHPWEAEDWALRLPPEWHLVSEVDWDMQLLVRCLTPYPEEMRTMVLCMMNMRIIIKDMDSSNNINRMNIHVSNIGNNFKVAWI